VIEAYDDNNFTSSQLLLNLRTLTIKSVIHKLAYSLPAGRGHDAQLQGLAT